MSSNWCLCNHVISRAVGTSILEREERTIPECQYVYAQVSLPVREHLVSGRERWVIIDSKIKMLPPNYMEMNLCIYEIYNLHSIGYDVIIESLRPPPKDWKAPNKAPGPPSGLRLQTPAGLARRSFAPPRSTDLTYGNGSLRSPSRLAPPAPNPWRTPCSDNTPAKKAVLRSCREVKNWKV